MSRCTVMPHVSSCLGRRVNTPARDLRPTPRRAQRRRVPLAGRAARTRTTARSSSSGVRGAHDLHLDHLQHPNTFIRGSLAGRHVYHSSSVMLNAACGVLVMS
jgi:hypothetical protein